MRQLHHIALSAIILIAGMLYGCSRPKPYLRYEGVTWGTTFVITYSSNVDLSDSIRAVMHDVDMSLSPFNPASALSRINSSDSLQKVDPMFRTVFDASLMINAMSHGAFDPTLGPVINLWGFGKDGTISRTPTPGQIDSAMAYVGIADCSIDSLGLFHKKHSGTQLNFSAIAKGYGCDLVAEMLERNGCHDFIVEIGGEMVVRGQSPRHSPWRVQIDAPVPGGTSVVHDGMAVIEIDSAAIATSGDYRNYVTIDSLTYGHTINPVTGTPARNRTLSVTVMAPSCMLADGLATAAMVLPMDSAVRIITALEGCEALFVTRDSVNEAWEFHATPGFPAPAR